MCTARTPTLTWANVNNDSKTVHLFTSEQLK